MNTGTQAVSNWRPLDQKSASLRVYYLNMESQLLEQSAINLLLVLS